MHFLGFVIKKQNKTKQMINKKLNCSWWLLKEKPLWTPQVGETPWSVDPPAGKGQKEKQRLELQESQVNPACFIWLVSLNELL